MTITMYGDQTDQQHDDDYGFWRDEPTSRLERITERLPQLRGRFQRTSKEWQFGWDDEQVAEPAAPAAAPSPTAQPIPRPRPVQPHSDITAPTARLRRTDLAPTRPAVRPAARPAVRPATPRVATPAAAAFVDPLLRVRAQAPHRQAPHAEEPRGDEPTTVHAEEPSEVSVARRTAPGQRAGAGAAGMLQQVDPMLRRVGVLAVAIALLVPVAMSFGSDGDGPASVAPDNSTVAIGTPVASVDESATTLMEIGATVPPAPQQPSDQESSGNGSPGLGDASASGAAPSPAATGAPATPATESATPVRLEATEVSCSKEYEVVAGDYWILIADKVSVSLNELLAANRASATTAIFPGRAICLPANASAPTTAAPTTAAPVTTVKPAATTAPPTTAKPAPATTAVPVKSTYTRAEVEAIIRATWADDLEDEAVRIATRESNLIPTAKNWCCSGLFQIYFEVHKGWLAGYGVTSAQQLLDPHVNAFVAVALYNRAGGWGPWKL